MRLTRIKLRRLEAGLLQVELSQRAHIARARLSELECGHVPARPDELTRIAAALGIDPGDFGDVLEVSCKT